MKGVDRQQAGFAEFYEASRDACLRAVVASVGNRQLAEDLVAEAFSRAWAGWPKVSRHPAPRAWVVRTALNAGVSRWRKQRHEISLAGDEPAAPCDVSDSVDESLLAAMRELPERQREVIVLRLFLDLDTATTARVLGIADGTATAHMARAVAALRRQLGGSDDRYLELETTTRRRSE